MRYHFSPIVLVLSLLAAPLAAQSYAPATLASGCGSDWACSRVPAPVGFYVSAVEDGGRYVSLEDGTVWEIEISDRATTGSWLADDFVNLSWIAAPRGDYEYLLSRVGDSKQRAAGRLSGRRPAPLDQE